MKQPAVTVTSDIDITIHELRDAMRLFSTLLGRRTSPAKARAARANGKLGGRPKKRGART